MAKYTTVIGGKPTLQTIASGDLTGAMAAPPAIGGTTPAAGTFTKLLTTSSDLFASPYSMVGVGTTTPGIWAGVNVYGQSGLGGGSLLHIEGGANYARLVINCTGGSAQSEFHFCCQAAPSGTRNWRFAASNDGSWALGVFDDGYQTETRYITCKGGVITFPQPVSAVNCKPCTFATVSMTSTSLSPGTSDNATVSVSGATVGCCVLVNYADGTEPTSGGNLSLHGFCATAGVVTVMRMRSASASSSYTTPAKTVTVRAFN